jgi:hypothetical protein
LKRTELENLINTTNKLIIYIYIYIYIYIHVGRSGRPTLKEKV